jgi:hypothetical protein
VILGLTAVLLAVLGTVRNLIRDSAERIPIPQKIEDVAEVGHAARRRCLLNSRFFFCRAVTPQ